MMGMISGYFNQKKDEIKSDIKFLLVFGFLFCFFRIAIFDYYIIPSSSMTPGLLVGDCPLTQKWTYGYSKHSIWFSPGIFKGRICSRYRPSRGEIIVFKMPKDNSTNIIKRVIGLPGDTVQVKKGVVYVNGEALVQRYVRRYLYKEERSGREFVMDLYEETMVNSDIKYDVIYYPGSRDNTNANNTELFVVPSGCYFVIGDNRDNSEDSRLGLGVVPEINLMGRAYRVIFSIGNNVRLWQPWLWLQNIRYERLLKKIQ